MCRFDFQHTSGSLDEIMGNPGKLNHSKCNASIFKLREAIRDAFTNALLPQINPEMFSSKSLDFPAKSGSFLEKFNGNPLKYTAF